MTGFVRQWLLGIVAAALAAALADCLISQASVRRLARLAGGVLMALALLRPLGALAGIPLSLEDWRGRREALTEQYQAAQNETLTAIIEEETAAYIVDKAALIYSVDSVRIAEEISREAVKKQITVSILIEVNIAGEDTKFGAAPEETEALVREIAQLPGIHIEGLMTIAPYVDDAEENRQYFSRLKQLSVDIKRKNIDNVSMNVLSMGMTGDYMVAVEEGASYVRVGTGIFGERQYPV